jgi:hypothetical protein
MSALGAEHPGRIPADIVERDGSVYMVKTCEKHGRVEDLLCIDPAFMRRIERLFPGRDFELRDCDSPAAASVRYGRGAVLTVDLTNRCNMMCEPCFMDANQVGYVHELEWSEVQRILDGSVRTKPRRQLSVQFSGGEPTLSPHFLDAVRYARDVGYFCVQCASNGIRFAQEPDFCHAAKSAGLRLCYLQFDGMSNEANRHRKVANLFDVKLRAIDNLARAGVDVVLVVTVVKGQNDDQVGEIIRFAAENADKISVVSFQPVSFTGRDEEIDDEERALRRYTLSHLVHDVRAQLGITEPLRDWFPLSSLNCFSDTVDLLLGPKADFGALNCGCHPDCGVGTALLANKRTGKAVPLSDFVNVERLLLDMQEIADAGLGRRQTLAEMAISLCRNFDAARAPEGYGLLELLRQFVSQTGASGGRIGATEGDSRSFEWRLLFVAGMWFQDSFNYDFRRTEMCIVPYGTEFGEVSFCAYNSGVGFRQVIERQKKTATTAEWYRTRGRHPVYADHRELPLPTTPLRVVVSERRHLRVVACRDGQLSAPDEQAAAAAPSTAPAQSGSDSLVRD